MTTPEPRLRIGFEAGHDPGWPAGLIYVKNVVETLAVLPLEVRPLMRILPLNVATLGNLGGLAHTEGVEIEAPSNSMMPLRIRLLARRGIRKYIQPGIGRIVSSAFRGLDVTFPDWGRPIPGIPQIHWIPDLQHLHLPHLFDDKGLARRKQRCDSTARSRGILILSSKAALKDFVKAYPQARVAPRVWTFSSNLTEGGRSDGIDVRERFDLPKTYLYIGNQFWAHKDHLTAFKAVALLRARGIRVDVVCTGLAKDARNPAYQGEVDAFIREKSLGGQIAILGVVPRPDQIQIIRQSAAVLQPSLFEGWSTVIEDAKALGKRLIASDIPVHKEQAPDATFFKSGDPEHLVDVLSGVLDQLVPGPDLEAETEARIRTETLREKQARAFLDIASEAAQLRVAR